MTHSLHSLQQELPTIFPNPTITGLAPQAGPSHLAPRLPPGPLRQESVLFGGPDTASFRDAAGDQLFFRPFRSEEEDLAGIMDLVAQELSEPYNVYTYRYFLEDWPHLTFLVYPTPTAKRAIATIVCKQDSHKGKTNRGYIAMLSVDKVWRRRGIASRLVEMAIAEMAARGAHEVVLETETDNESSLALYGALGFLREKRIQRFYSNGKDAFRLIRPLPTYPRFEESDDEAEAGRQAVSSGPAGDHPMYHTQPAGHPPVQPAEMRDAQGAVPAPPPPPPIPTRPAPLPADQAWGMYT